MSRTPLKQVSKHSPDIMSLASLFEGDFSIDWLQTLAGQKATHILAVLEEGVRSKILATKDYGVYRFCNEKSRRRLQKYLTSTDRERWHCRAAEILLKELSDDSEKARKLSTHLLHTQNDVKGCRLLIQAGDHHRKAFRNELAYRCYGKALEDLAPFPGDEADHLFINSAVKYSKVSTDHHEFRQTLSVLKEAVTRAKAQDDRNSLALLYMHLAKNEFLLSHYRKTYEYFNKGQELTQYIDNPKTIRSINTFVTFFLWWCGRFREAVQNYEKLVPDVDKWPKGGFPLLAVVAMGHCYVSTGNVTQGLGMLDAILTQAKNKRDLTNAAWAACQLGNAMILLGQVENALASYEEGLDLAVQGKNHYIGIFLHLCLAYAWHLKSDNKKSFQYLSKFLDLSSQAQVDIHQTPFLLILRWEMEQGRYPRIEGICLEKEIQRSIRSGSFLIKGFGYRYLALARRASGDGFERVLGALKRSSKIFEEHGIRFEWAKVQMEIAREYLREGFQNKAYQAMKDAVEALGSHGEALIPDSLRPLIKDLQSEKDLLDEILDLGQEMVTISRHQDLLRHMVMSSCRIFGAERGAIFLQVQDGPNSHFDLRAAMNLTSEDVDHPTFEPSMDMIKEAAATGEANMMALSTYDGKTQALFKAGIRSCICVPMNLRGHVVGVIYHDNRLLTSAFKVSDLKIFKYFAAQAAVALDNAKAYQEIQRLNQKLNEEKNYLNEQHSRAIHFEDLIGKSPAILKVLNDVHCVAGTEANALITGETGVGKELVARAIYRLSPRQVKPFIRVDCSAYPETLITSALFGHERGAFTGAISRQIGRFELADGGTLFLDEVGEIPLEIQVRLLRVIQSKEFERVGGVNTIRSNFRLMAATSRDLKKEVQAGRFRQDLYFRLNVFPIHVPPLRERREDIPLLSYYFLKTYANKSKKSITKIPYAEMEKLIKYDWPGNVRELENVIERAVILSYGPYLHIPELVRESQFAPSYKKDVSLQENERNHIRWALKQTGWKIRGRGGAAELLRIHPNTLDYRIKKLGIKRPEKSSLPYSTAYLLTE